MFKYLAIIALGFVFAMPCAAQKLPLPPEVLRAKTVFVDNQTGIAASGDIAYSEFLKWGRFTVVTDDPSRADLVVLLTATEYVAGYRTWGSNNATTWNPTTTTTFSSTNSTAITGGNTYMALVDPKTGNAVWRNMQAWGRKPSARVLMEDLKKRIQEQERAAK